MKRCGHGARRLSSEQCRAPVSGAWCPSAARGPHQAQRDARWAACSAHPWCAASVSRAVLAGRPHPAAGRGSAGGLGAAAPV